MKVLLNAVARAAPMGCACALLLVSVANLSAAPVVSAIVESVSGRVTGAGFLDYVRLPIASKRHLLRSQTWRSGQEAFLSPLFDSHDNEKGRMHLIATATLLTIRIPMHWQDAYGCRQRQTQKRWIIALERARGRHV